VSLLAVLVVQTVDYTETTVEWEQWAVDDSGNEDDEENGSMGGSLKLC
jgi:hypothetical protein